MRSTRARTAISRTSAPRSSPPNWPQRPPRYGSEPPRTASASAWTVSHGSTRCAEPRSERCRCRLPSPAARAGDFPDTRQIVATPYGVWAIAPSLQPVELDLRSGGVVQVAHNVFATALAYGAGRLWAVSGFDVVPIDARTGRVGAPINVPSLFYLGGIAVGGGSIWVTSSGEGVVWQIELGARHRVTTD